MRNSGPIFSVLVPTKHRPNFIGKLLRSIEAQNFAGVEVIVSDNFKDSANSFPKYVGDYSCNIEVISPQRYLNMVENWNFVLTKAKGEYIIFLTDKMLMLPGLLGHLEKVISKQSIDIINWVDDKWYPESYGDYFKNGYYSKSNPGEAGLYDGIEELSQKASGLYSRKTQTPSQYARGKICFGAYRRGLVEMICEKYDRLFHHISPDYTSMILGLSEAKSTFEISRPGVVHMHTDLSNGGKCDVMPECALKFLHETNQAEELINSMPVRGVFSSTHNSLLSDYVRLKEKYNLHYEINFERWFVEIGCDLLKEEMKWKSQEEKKEHLKMFNTAIESVFGDNNKKIMGQIRDKMPRPRSHIVLGLRAIAKKILKPILKSGYSSYGSPFTSIEEAMEEFYLKKSAV